MKRSIWLVPFVFLIGCDSVTKPLPLDELAATVLTTRLINNDAVRAQRLIRMVSKLQVLVMGLDEMENSAAMATINAADFLVDFSPDEVILARGLMGILRNRVRESTVINARQLVRILEAVRRQALRYSG